MCGLGNQFFQYAYARSLKELGYDVFLDNTSFFDFDAHLPSQTFRTYFLDNFNISINPADKNMCELFRDAHKISLASRLFRKFKKIFMLRLKVKNFTHCNNYAPELLCIEDNTYISGFFQSEKYFIKIRDLLLDELTLKKDYSYKEDNLFINESNIVAIHIRRGDYVSLECALNIDYYMEALRIVEERIQNPYYFIFSDDPDFCIKNLQLKDRRYSFINTDRQYTDCEEFILMSKCHHHIIANSSFSWWAAWLSQSVPSRLHMVISPSNWPYFESAEGWIKI
jgi:hypothetical protein